MTTSEIPSTNTTSERPSKVQQLAQILGQPGIEFVNWQELMGEGFVVHITIGRTRFRKKLSYRDLGLVFSDEKTAKTMSEVFNLGMKNLLPKDLLDKLDRIEYRARNLEYRYGIATVWGPFVPWTAFADFKTEVAALEKEYFATRDEIVKNHGQILHKVLGEYKTASRNAYRIIKGLDEDKLSTEEQAREAIYLLKARKQIRNLFPSKGEIERSFVFRLKSTYIDLPRLAGSDQEEPIAPGSIIKEAIDGLTKEDSDDLRWLQQASKDKAAMLRAMNEEVVREARKQKKEMIDDFLTQVITQVRGLLYETCINVLASIKNNEKLENRSMVSLRTMVRNIQNLNFYNDVEVDKMVNLIDGLVGKEGESFEKKNLADIERVLRQAGTVMRATLLTLDYESRVEREEEKLVAGGISSEPSAREEREAREALNLSVPEWLVERGEREEETYLVTAAAGPDEREDRTSW